MTKLTAVPGHKTSPLDPPATLSQPAADLWRSLLSEYELNDAAALSILAAGLAAWDRAEAARGAIDGAGLMIGRPAKPHPLLRVERDCRAQFLGAMKQLAFDIEPLRDGPGRPPGNR